MLGYQQEQQAVAQAAFQDAGNPADWTQVELHYVSQAGAAMLDFTRTDGSGGAELLFDYTSDLPYERLREAMADEHGAWVSSRMTLTPQGEYRFTFNYDQKQDWPDGRPITPDSWVEDLRRHPRPWAEIPDWHPVKEQFTQESWARELAERP